MISVGMTGLKIQRGVFLLAVRVAESLTGTARIERKVGLIVHLLAVVATFSRMAAMCGGWDFMLQEQRCERVQVHEIGN